MVCVSLRYAAAVKMYDWLIEAFGFEKHAAYYTEDGRTLLHGEPRMGSSFVMLGSSEGNPFGKRPETRSAQAATRGASSA